jgi:hypothetical protein
MKKNVSRGFAPVFALIAILLLALGVGAAVFVVSKGTGFLNFAARTKNTNFSGVVRKLPTPVGKRVVLRYKLVVSATETHYLAATGISLDQFVNREVKVEGNLLKGKPPYLLASKVATKSALGPDKTAREELMPGKKVKMGLQVSQGFDPETGNYLLSANWNKWIKPPDGSELARFRVTIRKAPVVSDNTNLVWGNFDARSEKDETQKNFTDIKLVNGGHYYVQLRAIFVDKSGKKVSVKYQRVFFIANVPTLSQLGLKITPTIVEGGVDVATEWGQAPIVSGYTLQETKMVIGTPSESGSLYPLTPVPGGETTTPNSPTGHKFPGLILDADRNYYGQIVFTYSPTNKPKGKPITKVVMQEIAFSVHVPDEVGLLVDSAVFTNNSENHREDLVVNWTAGKTAVLDYQLTGFVVTVGTSENGSTTLTPIADGQRTVNSSGARTFSFPGLKLRGDKTYYVEVKGVYTNNKNATLTKEFRARSDGWSVDLPASLPLDVQGDPASLGGGKVDLNVSWAAAPEYIDMYQLDSYVVTTGVDTTNGGDLQVLPNGGPRSIAKNVLTTTLAGITAEGDAQYVIEVKALYKDPAYPTEDILPPYSQRDSWSSVPDSVDFSVNVTATPNADGQTARVAVSWSEAPEHLANYDFLQYIATLGTANSDGSITPIGVLWKNFGQTSGQFDHLSPIVSGAPYVAQVEAKYAKRGDTSNRISYFTDQLSWSVTFPVAVSTDLGEVLSPYVYQNGDTTVSVAWNGTKAKKVRVISETDGQEISYREVGVGEIATHLTNLPLQSGKKYRVRIEQTDDSGQKVYQEARFGYFRDQFNADFNALSGKWDFSDPKCQEQISFANNELIISPNSSGSYPIDCRMSPKGVVVGKVSQNFSAIVEFHNFNQTSEHYLTESFYFSPSVGTPWGIPNYGLFRNGNENYSSNFGTIAEIAPAVQLNDTRVVSLLDGVMRIYRYGGILGMNIDGLADQNNTTIFSGDQHSTVDFNGRFVLHARASVGDTTPVKLANFQAIWVDSAPSAEAVAVAASPQFQAEMKKQVQNYKTQTTDKKAVKR